MGYRAPDLWLRAFVLDLLSRGHGREFLRVRPLSLMLGEGADTASLHCLGRRYYVRLTWEATV